MPAYVAKIIVTVRKSILDPQGKAIRHALAESLAMTGIEDVRLGKYIEMRINGKDKKEAERLTGQACQKLLSNPVMEDYSFTVDEL